MVSRPAWLSITSDLLLLLSLRRCGDRTSYPPQCRLNARVHVSGLSVLSGTRLHLTPAHLRIAAVVSPPPRCVFAEVSVKPLDSRTRRAAWLQRTHGLDFRTMSELTFKSRISSSASAYLSFSSAAVSKQQHGVNIQFDPQVPCAHSHVPIS